MPRTYRPTGKRQYKKHNESLIDLALQEYNSTKISLTKLSKKYNIAKTVLHRHNTFHTKKQGGQNALHIEEEEYLIKYINICSEWGYPLETIDLRCLVKGYLDELGYTVKRFKNNMPGPDYVQGFLKRHKEKITTRFTQNIKRSRAEVSPDIIENYFTELATSLEGVPLSNIVNYDETNLADDPARKKVLVRRSVKYPERIMNHTKGSTSIMMAAAADGTLLPPYVVYKAQYVYDTWRLNGPRGCRYNSTTSGWFDALCFQDWVKTIAIPYFSDKSGVKILIGDNLSSHLSIDLIRECKDIYNIRFIFLPANSTHLTQPLDVAIFRPLKIKWRDLLYKWKKYEGSNYATVPKQCFPALLKKLMHALEDTIAQNIKSGFLKCGISPIDKNKVLERIPNYKPNEEYKEAIDSKVMKLLQDMRYGVSSRTPIPNKKKKNNVLPGRSVENHMISEESNDSNTEEVPEVTQRAGTSKKLEQKKGTIKRKKNKEISKESDCKQLLIEENLDSERNLSGCSKIKEIKNECTKMKGKKTNNTNLVKRTKPKNECNKGMTKKNLEPPIFKKPYPVSPLLTKDTNIDWNSSQETVIINKGKENDSKELNKVQKDQEKTLEETLPTFDEILKMPLVFEDLFTVSNTLEVTTESDTLFLDKPDTNNIYIQNPVTNAKSSKIKIISEKLISDNELKKIKTMKASSESKILKMTDKLKIKRPKYYRNESEILSDLTDEDFM